MQKKIDHNVKEHPIFDVVRILGRSLQSEYMEYLLYTKDEENNLVPNLDWSSLGFDPYVRLSNNYPENITLDNIIKQVKSSKKIILNKDLILPWPWRKSKFVRSLFNIGEGRKFGKWKQDYNNHFVQVWLPMGIAWVVNGNHSICMGIIQGGELEPEGYYDISEVYKYVDCDGVNYIKKEDNSVISEVKNVEFAAIFEIGRLLNEKGLSFI